MRTLATHLIASAVLLIAGIGTATASTYWNYPLVLQDSLDTPLLEEQEGDEDIYPAEHQQKEETKRGDTTFIKVANKDIQIIEQDGETQVKIKKQDEEYSEDMDDDFDYEEDFKENKKGSDFKGHWSGIEVGLNNFLNADNSMNRSAENAFMELNTGKSWNVNFNFSQYSLGFGTDRVGLVTGMGLEWNNYHFSDTNSIQKTDQGIIARAIPENTKKNRFQTTYLTIPMILELQFLEDNEGERAYLGFGVIGGVKLFSNTKIKYVENGSNQKEKVKDDFNLSPLRYALTARLGYRSLKLYMNYYPTPLFIEGKGPDELYPISAGLVMAF